MLSGKGVEDLGSAVIVPTERLHNPTSAPTLLDYQSCRSTCLFLPTTQARADRKDRKRQGGNMRHVLSKYSACSTAMAGVAAALLSLPAAGQSHDHGLTRLGTVVFPV